MKTSLIFCATLALAASLGSAADLGGGIATKFKQLDTNGDGKLSTGEVAAFPMLKNLDANGNGEITLEEAQRVIAMLTGGGKKPEPASEIAPPPFTPADSPREEAKLLKAADHRVGSLIDDVVFTDLDGKRLRLSDVAGGQPLIVAMYSSSCPVSKKYGPTLAQLSEKIQAQKARLLLVAPVGTDTPAELRAALKSAGLVGPCAFDPKGELAGVLGALSTTDAFLLDGARTLIYRGAIDDQYGLGYSLDAPRKHYLADAIAALTAGRAPDIAATEAPGCLLALKAAPPTTNAPTYHNRISRLVQANCQQCHRTGGVAPFALETAEQIEAKSAMIRKMVSRDLMPPWFAKPPGAGQHSPWMNDRTLAGRDKADLLAWLDAGKPLGDSKDAPLPRHWPADWQIGTPDAVVEIPRAIEIKATGTMPYQNVVADPHFTEDKWVRGFEIQPTAREVVHHVLVFAQNPNAGIAEKLDQVSGFFAAYVPGNNSIVYPDGFAKPLPAGSKLLFQIHYTPNGTATRDQIKIGLLFAKEPPQHIVRTIGIGAHRLSIPPNDANHPESATIPVPKDVKLLGFMPHMHVRGKAFRYEAILPDGTTRTLLEVPRYDFNWQLAYRYAEPPTIPAGSTMRAIGWFDNSANNPANPDPNKTVKWGPQTTDEMMLGYVEYYFPTEIVGLPKQLSAAP